MKGIHIFFISIFLLIKYISSSYCGSYIPYDGDSCFQYTNESSICCFLRGNFEGNYHTMCYPFDRSIYYKMSRQVKINGYLYSVDCGESRGTLCGDVVNPVSYKDCSIYSKSDNSCCFYKYYYKLTNTSDEYEEETNCVWLGTGDIGEMSYKRLQVICGAKITLFNKYNFILILILFIFML